MEARRVTTLDPGLVLRRAVPGGRTAEPPLNHAQHVFGNARRSIGQERQSLSQRLPVTGPEQARERVVVVYPLPRGMLGAARECCARVGKGRQDDRYLDRMRPMRG